MAIISFIEELVIIRTGNKDNHKYGYTTEMIITFINNVDSYDIEKEKHLWKLIGSSKDKNDTIIDTEEKEYKCKVKKLKKTNIKCEFEKLKKTNTKCEFEKECKGREDKTCSDVHIWKCETCNGYVKENICRNCSE